MLQTAFRTFTKSNRYRYHHSHCYRSSQSFTTNNYKLRSACTYTGSAAGDTIMTQNERIDTLQEKYNELEQRFNSTEKRLCTANSLLWIYRNDIPWKKEHKVKLDKLMVIHRSHCKEDIEELLRQQKLKLEQTQKEIKHLNDILNSNNSNSSNNSNNSDQLMNRLDISSNSDK